MPSASPALRIESSVARLHPTEQVPSLRREDFRGRVERVFAEARPIIMERRGTLDPSGRPLLGQTMGWDDFHAMTQGDARVERLTELLRTHVGEILSVFGLHEYHIIPEGARFTGRADDILERRELHSEDSALRTVPDSHVVLHPGTWAKLYLLAAEYRARFGEPISIASGYRSDAYQLYLLAYNASRIDDPEHPGQKLSAVRPLEEVFRTVAPPFCSEHSMAVPAFDIGNFMDRPHDLRSTAEWIWLRDAALELGIVESYPDGTINRGYGEPWHWRDDTTAA